MISTIVKMKLRLWIPCILLLVILVMFYRTYTTEGFQASPVYVPPPAQSVDQTRLNFWSILAQAKAGLPITAGSGSGPGSGSGSSPSLLSQVTNPGPKDTFTMVYPKYLSMYSLAKYGFDPATARSALINQYDTLQKELQTMVETEQNNRALFTADPKGQSCTEINTLTMGFYGQLLSLYRSTQDLSGAAISAGNFHDENSSLQNRVVSLCTAQGGLPSADCIKLASMDEKLFPLLPKFDAMNTKLMKNGRDIQENIDTLVEAYLGMGCTRPATMGSSDQNALSIDTVFSSEYLESLATVDTETLSTKLQELSPYYVSPRIINYISAKFLGTPEFDEGISTSLDYLKDMNKTTNRIVSLNTDVLTRESGKQYNESTGGFTICPAGYYCPVTTSMPIQCPVATYCPEGTTDAPIDCPRGTFSPPGSVDSSKCTSTSIPLGYYIEEGTQKLIQCPTGSYCVNGVRTTCPTGTYNKKKGMSDESSCLKCPKGSYCKTTTSVTACAKGTYNNQIGQSAESACLPCPAGTFCANTGTVTPSPCAAGTFSSATGVTTGCNPVQAGYYLPATGSLNDAAKRPCTVGTYCPGGTANAVTCTPGTYCDVAELTAPKPCPGGRYGATSGLTSSTCTGLCDPGYICPPGSVVGYAIPCPMGTYCERGSAVATTCPAGYYCGYETGSPTACPTGTYNTSKGKGELTDCLPCPPGKVCGPATADEGAACPIGSYCPGGSAVNPCIPGSYCDDTGLQEPKLCPAGTYGSSTAGLSLITECKPCAAGTWSSSVGEAGSCSQTCPPGSYCPSPNSSMSYTVPAATLPLYSANNTPSTLLPINGKIALPIGSKEPIVCPAGTYCPSTGMSAPTKCAVGTYSSLTGQTTSGVCTPCAPGTYCPTAGGGSAILCPPGTFCPTSGGSSPNQCAIAQICPIPGLQAGSSCPPGQLCDTPSLVTPRTNCPPGTFSIGGAGSACSPCPAGYYGAGASTTNQCSGLCPAGYYCALGTTPLGTSGSGSNPPVPCPLGYYCPTGTGGCAPGTYLLNQLCVTCRNGSYCLGGITPPVACPAGQLSGEGARSSSACATMSCDSNSTSLLCVNVSSSVGPPNYKLTVPFVVRVNTPIAIRATIPGNAVNTPWAFSVIFALGRDVNFSVGPASTPQSWTPTEPGQVRIALVNSLGTTLTSAWVNVIS